MICPKCRNYNDDGAKFCRKCGSPLNHQNNVSVNQKPQKSFLEKNKLLIIAIVIVAIVALAIGAFAISSVNHQTPVSQSANQSVPVESTSSDDSSSSVSASPTTESTSASPSSSSSSPLKIQGGHFYTGTELEDKTYAKFYVGPEHGGESVYVQIFYSRDGNALNNGNMVPVTVSSGGFVKVTSADAYSLFPDHATIKLYDANQNLQDTVDINLSPTSGTQTF